MGCKSRLNKSVSRSQDYTLWGQGGGWARPHPLEPPVHRAAPPRWPRVRCGQRVWARGGSSHAGFLSPWVPQGSGTVHHPLLLTRGLPHGGFQ